MRRRIHAKAMSSSTRGEKQRTFQTFSGEEALAKTTYPPPHTICILLLI
jgi:hypothetical protein